MNDRVCDNCKKIYSSKSFTSCPYCNSQVHEEPVVDNTIDKEFKIEYNPQEKKSLKEDFKGIIVLLAIAIIILGSLFPMVAITGLIFFGEISIGEIPSPMFIILAILFIGIFVAVIYLLILLIKHKYLMKHGVILRNVGYVVTKNNIRLSGQTTGLIKVKIDYISEDGRPCVFKGILPGYLVKKGNVCDVLVDPNNYKKYIIRYDID